MAGGWHPDPTGRHQERFHDGASWTERVKDRGVEILDRSPVPDGAAPVGAAPASGSSATGSVGGSGRAFGVVGGASLPRDSVAVGRTSAPSPAAPVWTSPEPLTSPASAPPPPAPLLAPPVAPPFAVLPPPPVGVPVSPPIGVGPDISVGGARGRRSRVRPAGDRPGWLAPLVVVLTLLVVAVAVGGAVYVVRNRTPTRSAENFCKTMKAEQARIRAGLDEATASAAAAGDDFAEALLSLTAGVQALGELEVYFRKLAKVAPEEIEAETELLSEKIGGLTEVPEPSITGLAGSFLASLQLAGPLNTVNSYALDHCGQGI